MEVKWEVVQLGHREIMALWYETGNGMVKTNLARTNTGLDVYLCGSGPSLSGVKNENLRIPGVLVAAINSAYPHIRPDIWFGMDEPNCWPMAIWWESFMKIARGGYHDRYYGKYLIAKCPNVYFADCAIPEHKKDIFSLLEQDVMFVWHDATILIAIHILVWMGARTIHLVGCDLGGPKGYDKILTKSQRKYSRRAYVHQNKYLKWFSGESKQHDIELISCTPVSPINEYLTYRPLKDALKVSRAKVPTKV